MHAHKLNTREHLSPNTLRAATQSQRTPKCQIKPRLFSVKEPGFPTWKQTRWLPCLRPKHALRLFAGSHLNGVTGWLTGVQRRRVSRGSWLGKRDQRMAAPWIRAPQWSIVNWAPCVKATERLVCTAAAICHNCP